VQLSTLGEMGKGRGAGGAIIYARRDASGSHRGIQMMTLWGVLLNSCTLDRCRCRGRDRTLMILVCLSRRTTACVSRSIQAPRCRTEINGCRIYIRTATRSEISPASSSLPSVTIAATQSMGACPSEDR
jgi:hypothetical protein